MDEYVNCGQSLSGGELTLPWEDGDNPNAYIIVRAENEVDRKHFAEETSANIVLMDFLLTNEHWKEFYILLGYTVQQHLFHILYSNL